MRKLKDEYADSCNNMVGLTYDDIVKNHIICSGNYIEELENKVDKYKELLNESELRRYDLRRCLDRLNRNRIELEQQKAELIDIMKRINGLCKSKAVNNHLDQIFLISDIALNKLQKENIAR